MKSTHESGLVLWAVDPVPEDKELQFKTVKAIAKLTKAIGASIEPVSVLSSERLKIPANLFRMDSKEYELEADTLLKAWVKNLKIPNLMPPRLLAHGIHADTNAVNTLLNYAREKGASFIVLSSHTRKKWERFFLGSFAETMILKSDVPILIVNPRNPMPTKFSNVLFPTDFSDASRVAFQTLLPTVRDLKGRITLYYKFDYIIPQTVDAMALTPAYGVYLKTDFENKRKTAAHWVEQAQKMGIKVDVILDDKPTFVPEGIINAVKKSKADLIAMASSSGALATALIGSLTRQVVRMATVPVWVIHPPKEAKALERTEKKGQVGNVRVVA